MSSEDDTYREWAARVEQKIKDITAQVDQGVIKAAFFCEGEAKKNVMNQIYNTPIAVNDSGQEMWKRTGELKASIGSGKHPDREHSAVIYATAPYAKYVEYGTGIFATEGGGRNTPWLYKTNTGLVMWTQGMRARPFMWPAVNNNHAQIRDIMLEHISKVVRQHG